MQTTMVMGGGENVGEKLKMKVVNGKDEKGEGKKEKNASKTWEIP